MNHPEPKRIRRSAEFDELLLIDVWEVAREKNWSFSYACYILLQFAIKEKNRKKKKNYSDSENKK